MNYYNILTQGRYLKCVFCSSTTNKYCVVYENETKNVQIGYFFACHNCLKQTISVLNCIELYSEDQFFNFMKQITDKGFEIPGEPDPCAWDPQYVTIVLPRSPELQQHFDTLNEQHNKNPSQ